MKTKAAIRLPARAVGLACLLALALGGCERAAQNMYDQPRGKPYRASTLFPDGAMSRTPPAGTQAFARGSQADTTSGREGTEDVARDARALAATAMPEPVTPAMLRQGQTLYGVYCLPCHSPAGDGDGRIVERGFPAPPSYHDDRLRNVPDRHIFDVIGKGYGVMAPYGNRIRPQDRWAIVAFVRALQLSQHADVEKLPPDLRAQARAALALPASSAPGAPAAGPAAAAPAKAVGAAAGPKASGDDTGGKEAGKAADTDAGKAAGNGPGKHPGNAGGGHDD